MSNYHVLTQDKDRKTAAVIFHIAVPPTGTNEAGLPWRDAVVAAAGGADSISSAVSNITQEELTSLKAGELLEVPKTVRFTSINLTNAERKAQIEALYTDLALGGDESVLVDKQVELEWIGYSGDVA